MSRRVAELDLDDNQSVWVATTPAADPLPALTRDEVVDLCVIGGGFTGLSTALHVAERFPDKKIAVLEARRLGNGGSGRNGGQMLNWINGVEVKDAERARRVFEFTRSGIDLICDTIQRHQLPVPFRRDGALESYTHADRAEYAAKKTEMLRSWGIPVEYLDTPALKKRLWMEGTVGAVLDPTAGHVHGLAYVNALAGLLRAKGVAMYEQTPVTSVTEGATIEVGTPGATIRSKAIVIATNGYTPRLGYFKTGVFPLHSHVLATEPLSPARWAEIGVTGPEGPRTAGFTDDLDRIAYGCFTTDGRMVFGGGSNAAYGYRYGGRTAYGDISEASWEAIRTRLLHYFPGLASAKITHRWTGTLGITMSRNCSMGAMGAHKNILYALGYSGHGVVLANLAGRVLADVYAGEGEQWRDMPFYERPLGGIPPEPFRYVGYQFFTALTGRSPRKNEA